MNSSILPSTLIEAYYPRDYNRNVLIESYLLETGLPPGRLLMEKKGVFKNILVDAGQAALSTGAIAATGGAGGDVVVDVIFAAKIAGKVVGEVTSLLQAAGEIGAIILQAANLDFDGSLAFEKKVQALLALTVKNQIVGNKAKEFMVDASKKINEILEKIARAIGKWVGALIPDDFGLGGPAFEALFEAVLKKSSENIYKIVITGIKALPMGAGKYLIDKDALEDLLYNISTSMIEYVDGLSEWAESQREKLESETAGDKFRRRADQTKKSFTSSIRTQAAVAKKAYGKVTRKGDEYNREQDEAISAALEDYSDSFKEGNADLILSLSEEGIPQVRGFLDKFRNEWIPTTVAVMRKLMSWLMAGLVIFQELVDPEKYLKMKTKMTPLEKEMSGEIESWNLSDMKLAAGYNRGNQMKLSERKLRSIVRKSILTENLSALRSEKRDLLDRDYVVVDEDTRYPYGRNRGDVRRTTVYKRVDDQPIPSSDLSLLQKHDDEERRAGGPMAALGGVHTTSVSDDGMQLNIKYYKHTAG